MNGPWKIPDHWKWATLGAKTTVVGGGTPPTSDPANYEDGEIPWITPADLSGYTDILISRGRRNITQQGLHGSGAKMMPAGTVLFSSRAPIGYVAIAANPVSTNQGFKSFVPGPEVLPHYLYYYLKRAKDLALSMASGTTFPEISGRKAAEIPVPIPPLDEQRDIVAEIETQFARLDDAVAALQRARTRLKRYRASVLKAACEGRLVPTEAELARQEGREYEPASVLLERIKAERDAAPGKKRGARSGNRTDTRSVPTNDLPALPEGWAWTTLAHVLSEGPQNGLYKPATEYGEGVPIVRIDDFQDFFHRERSNLRRVRVSDQDLQSYGLAPNDLIVNRVNSAPQLGKCLVVPESLCPAVFESNMMRMRLHESVRPAWVATYLRSRDGRDRLTKNAKWAVNQASINQNDVGITPLTLPPLDEQSRIFAEVERVTSVIEQLEATVEANLKRAESLRQSVLRMAFNGRLIGKETHIGTR